VQKAEYPQRQCRDHVFNDHGMGYTCELPELHPGPHANTSVKTTVENRDRWEDRNPEWRDKIGESLDEV
jgi:hypothetical protein